MGTSEPTEGKPFSMGGNMKTVDLLYSKATNKQFITVQTRKGETYYLVIDYDKPLDKDGEQYETYFLNLVDDRRKRRRSRKIRRRPNPRQRLRRSRPPNPSRKRRKRPIQRR